MPFLRIGPVVVEVTASVAERWSTLEAESIAAASSRPHGRPTIVYRLAGGGSGVIGLVPEHPAVTDPGPASRPGVIEEAATTYGGLTPRDPEPRDVSDDEIAEMVRSLKEELPDLDWDNTLAGRLLGPATPDRPDFPVWEYAEVADRDPAVRLEELTAVRFPIRFADGPMEVASVDEELRPMPSHLRSVPRSRFRMDPRTIISRYATLHEAGLLEWDPIERGVVRLGTIDDYRFALEAWFATLPTEDDLHREADRLRRHR